MAMVLVRFDTQAIDKEIGWGAEYKQVTLAACEGGEYLLEKWGRKCVNSRTEDVRLQVEHIVPKAKKLQLSFKSNLGLKPSTTKKRIHRIRPSF
jgi:hypothetical protein